MFIGVLGRQLFTGSFHPVDDNQWENRSMWDISVAPPEGSTLLEIFERREVIKMAAVRLNLINSFYRIVSSLGRDVASNIVKYLSDEDCLSLEEVCRVELQALKKEPVIDYLPMPEPKSQLFIGSEERVLFLIY